MNPRGYSEDELVEQPALELLEGLGWATQNCMTEWDAGPSVLGREDMAEVVLVARLRPALVKLNPDLPPEAVDQAIGALTRDRSAMSLVAANREVYGLLKDGVPVEVPDGEGGLRPERVTVLDWRDPTQNDWFAASQFWITGELYTKRADVLGFVNGLPLVFLEFKATTRRLEDAYRKNLRDYKETIPQLFWYNALVLLSRGDESRVGSMTAGWEHFAEWKRIRDETEAATVSLETVLRGTCAPEHFLDLVENFTLFEEGKHGLVKIAAKNHQFLGVNNALRALQGTRGARRRLGVFWHTQGSGKSYSMMFLAQKVLRTVPGNWTFVVVTDRDELDTQIYKTFTRCGVVTETAAQATSTTHLRQLLSEDHRYVFTLIHKFRTEPGQAHPVLSTRDDVIVLADEAHRTQYDTLAFNMRTALPNAGFLAFTGTPLLAGEEKTREVFGDYVSIYNFQQSVEDEATVRLFYENRVPELHLVNPNLNEDIYAAIEAAELDEDQERKLERTLGREYHLLTRDDRLRRVAEDLVRHFVGRGFRGKAMMVCIDKATAVRMYEKVRAYWPVHQAALIQQLDAATEPEERQRLQAQIDFMVETDMAVVVSPGQNELDEMRRRGLDMRPHRERMNREALDEKFKDPDDPFRLVFVCAMWMTGFDVPSCSTIYLDKPLRNHTLMQTIARANRVFPEKVNGLIVDYANVFGHLEQALAIYGSGSGGRVRPGELPVEEKAALVARLERALAEARTFLTAHLVDLDGIIAASGLDRVGRLRDAVDAVVGSDATRREFVGHANLVGRLYKAILPDPAADVLAPSCGAVGAILQKLRAELPEADIEEVLGTVEGILDRSIASDSYAIRDDEAMPLDLSRLNVEALRQAFLTGPRRTQAERLRGAIRTRLARLIRLNRSRLDYLARFQELIDEYNSGALNVEVFFDRLIQFARELSQEEQRALTEELSEEELAVFDLLTRPELDLTEAQRRQVKKVCRDLLASLKQRQLVLEWRKRQQARAQVRLAIEEALEGLPAEKYPEAVYTEKCERVYQHIFEAYMGADRSIYSAAA